MIMYLFLENVHESGKIVLVLAAVSFEVALNDTITSLTHLALLTAKMYHMHQQCTQSICCTDLHPNSSKINLHNIIRETIH